MSQVLPPIVTQWLERISNRDAIGAADCFTEDAVYYFAMPHPPVQGRDHIRGMFSGQATMYKRISWEVTESAVDGDRVWMERLDRFFTHDDREIFIECVGVIELENGLISEVRDYVDLHTWEERNK